MMRKAMKTGVIVLLLGILTPIMSGCPDPDEVVVFRDRNIESAVRHTLGKPFGLFLTKTDMLTLNELDASGQNVQFLDGLEWALNLQTLFVQDNVIVDLIPLEGLVNLTLLNLSGNLLTDVGPLAGLSQLDHLILYGNNVFDPTPLLTNALNGGLGPGDTVEVDTQEFQDKDGNVNPIIQELANQGVIVVVVTSTAK